ncbi:hypothetical protein NDU88_005843 [Pleurodeles waltl]|uniref:Uncharacterized protein n=1 Tax=Pleurodeles waltl TaxID=8319 RepID=A0AAV7L3Q4_PLEWA|nr:hypothetical protein NDU88_005843 [Pleurodeles waltl]
MLPGAPRITRGCTVRARVTVAACYRARPGSHVAARSRLRGRWLHVTGRAQDHTMPRGGSAAQEPGSITAASLIKVRHIPNN